MKIKKEHLEELHYLLNDVCEELAPIEKCIKMYKENEIGIDPEKRFRWFLFWATNRKERFKWLDKIKEYGINDNHIDTALKAYVQNKKKEQNK